MEAFTLVLIDKIALRTAREKLWYGSANIYGALKTTDPITGITKIVNDAMLYENLPCKLSHREIKSDEQTDGPSRVVHSIKVSIGNEYNIPSGSKMVITQSGKTASYKSSGEAAQFVVHQEIPLVIDKRYS